jgi:PAS domain S-box-containing protein
MSKRKRLVQRSASPAVPSSAPSASAPARRGRTAEAAIAQSERARITKAVNYISCAILVGLVVPFIRTLLLGWYPGSAVLFALFASASACCLLNRRGFTRPAARVLCFSTLATALTVLWISPLGMHDEALFVVPAALVVAALLMDWRWYAGFASAAILAVSCVGLAEIGGLTENVRPHAPYDNGWLLNVDLILTLTAVVTGLLVRHLLVYAGAARRYAAAQLESEERYREFVENAPIGIYRTTPDGQIDLVNPAMVDMLGFESVEELKKRDLESKTYEPGYDRAEFKRIIEERGEIRGREDHWKRRDGSLVYVRESAKVVRRPDGAVESYNGVVEDITERKRIEEALRRSQERLESIAENSSDVIWVMDLQSGRFTYVSPAVTRVRGYTVEEVLAAPAMESLTPESRALTQEQMPRRLAAFAAGSRSMRSMTSEVRQPCKDGSFVDTEVITTLLTDADGRVREILGVSRNITERKRAEAENARLLARLQQVQKLESVGRLAGGVAHDFNNLLTIINGYAEMLLSKVPDASPLRAQAEQIRKAGERGAALTQQLLAFSRKQLIQPRPIDLAHNVDEAAEMLRRLLGEDIELRTPRCPHSLSVLADPGQIHQALMNLAANARDAMPDGGSLTLELDAQCVDAELAARLDIAPGGYVRLTVSDSGGGMDELTRTQIFEPFFTTKERGKGTGLGLSTVYGIVRQSQGGIGVTSVLGRGTTFEIYLPRVEPVAQAVPEGASAERIGRCSGTVLVVEDEDQVRALACFTLRDCGYHVLEAADGEAALKLAQAFGRPIDLLLTDVVMPGMNGRELAERLSAVRPATKILFTSGYTSDVIATRGVLEASVDLLPKPYTPTALAARVRASLDGNDASAGRD